MHPLLLPPQRRMSGTIRMPELQHVAERITQNLQRTLMDTDSLRRIKTTARNRIVQGPLASPQLFVSHPSGGVNTPESMPSGSHKMNSRRLVNKTPGQTAGIA